MICLIFLVLVALAHAVPLGNEVPQLQKVKGIDDGYLYQGDMILSKEEIKTALHGGDVDAVHQNTYGVQSSKRYRWKDGIVPYDLSQIKNPVLNALGIMGPTEKAVRNAMAQWEKKTCIRFVERTNEKDYLYFIDDGYGQCYSYVGRMGVGKQKLSLGFECFYEGIAIHEIGHALGMHHEQSRPDRDQYIEILWPNIKEAALPNFKKYTHHRINSLGSPYDYDSIMHYRWNAFAKWPLIQATIRSKNPSIPFGQRDHISVQDAIQINKYYECKI